MQVLIKCRVCGKDLGHASNIPREQAAVQSTITEAQKRYVCSEPGHMLNSSIAFEWKDDDASAVQWSGDQPKPKVEEPAKKEEPKNGAPINLDAEGARAAEEILRSIPASEVPS